MNEQQEKSTASLLDHLSQYDEDATDVLVERWAGLRSENQTLHAQLKRQGELGCAVKEMLAVVCFPLPGDYHYSQQDAEAVEEVKGALAAFCGE